MATAIEQTIEGKNLEQNQRKAVLTDGKKIVNVEILGRVLN